MSETRGKMLDRSLALLAVLAGLGGGLYSLFLLPYRMDAADRKIESLSRSLESVRSEGRAQAELLTRIDERVKFIKETVERGSQTKPTP